MPKDSRKIAAILAADIVGYSRLMGADDEGTLGALKIRRAIFDRLVQEFDGKEFGSVGDSLMAQFPSAINAVRCARNVQHAIAKENDSLPADRRMVLRIGVNLGDVIEENGALFGDGVNIAARLQAIATPGGILVSGAIYEQVKNKLSAGFTFVGARQVKNIAEPVACYEVTESVTARFTWPFWPWLRQGDRGKHRVRSAALTLIALLLALGGGILWRYQRTSETASVATPPSPNAVAPASDHSIAVLPFLNMSPDKDQEYFADGISEELLNVLSQVPELRVIGRTSSFQFKGKSQDLRVIGQKLGAAHLLEGSVRKAGNKVRIAAQLVSADDGSHLWADTYERTLEDIFAVQDDIAGQVVKALRVTLLKDDLAAPEQQQNIEAYNLFLQGRYFSQRQSPEDSKRAIPYLQRSIERDPAYAPAWVELANVYMTQADYGWIVPAKGYAAAREAVEKALALAPEFAAAHNAMGWIQSGLDYDWAAAEASHKKALALEPRNPEVLLRTGWLAAELGRTDEALTLIRKSLDLDPLRLESLNYLSILLVTLGHYAEAEAVARKQDELDPNPGNSKWAVGLPLLMAGKLNRALAEMEAITNERRRLVGLSLVYYSLGRQAESEAALASLKSRFADEMAYNIAEVHAWRGEHDLAFVWLDRAYSQRAAILADIKLSPFVRRVSEDPRYGKLLRRLKLPA
jgi:TolB-like protein/class 3 adenylate cyclase/Tfp pilus assembly protein PilF